MTADQQPQQAPAPTPLPAPAPMPSHDLYRNVEQLARMVSGQTAQGGTQ